MTRSIVTIPRSLMRQTRVDWQIDARGQDAGETNNSMSQTRYNAFPRWIGSPAIRLRREQILLWRGVMSKARGRMNIYRVPMIDPLGFDFDAAVAGREPPAFSGGETFDSGATFSLRPVAEFAAAFPIGATTVRIDMARTDALTLQVGQILSVSDKPFQIETILSVSGTIYEVDIWLPLRVSVTAGEPVALEATGLFEATSDLVGNPSYGRDHIARPELSFREVL